VINFVDARRIEASSLQPNVAGYCVSAYIGAGCGSRPSRRARSRPSTAVNATLASEAMVGARSIVLTGVRITRAASDGAAMIIGTCRVGS
jgi:hypothetical protein